VRADHGSNIAAVDTAPVGLQQIAAENSATLPVPWGSPRHRGGLATCWVLSAGLPTFGIEFERRGDRQHFVGQVSAGVHERLGDRAVDHAGIKVAIAVMLGQPFAERAFARSRGSSMAMIMAALCLSS